MPVEPAQQYLAYIHERYRQLRESDKAPANLENWQRLRQTLRDRLLASWGGFPETPCELAPRQLGELKRDGYAIEKLVLQTRPGVLMTANAYIPDGAGKRPAVLCVHGHWKGAKQDPVPQARCIGLAKLGFFVLAVDAFGAGERGIGKALGEYHGEMTGATLWPVGLPLSGLQVYENMRAVDYLLTRPEVDGTKLGITGASGGGNQSMYAGAFDERFSCVVPVCSVGTYRAYLGAACCVCEVVPDITSFTEEWAVLALVAPRALMVLNATRDAFQFSVGEAQQSIARAQQVFRLHGKAERIAHTLFESGHDYNRPMREAMYGWMTLHLKGEGQGNPIPEPAMTLEEPETLRCFPGASRPDDFITLPRFAAAEATRCIERHHRERPDHREQWESTSMRLRHTLEQDVLGGFPRRGKLPVREPQPHQFVLETEPGIEITAIYEPATGRQNERKLAIVVDLDGIEKARQGDLTKALSSAGWDLLFTDLRATGRYAVKGDQIGKASDHNSAEWGTMTGRPLLGQWVWDVRSVCEALAERDPALLAGATLVGVGPGSVVALCAGLYESRLSRVVLVNPLVSFRSDAPYSGQRMGILAPRILRDAGDVPQLAAGLAPRKLIVAGGVRGSGEALAATELNEQFAYTRHIYKLLGVEGHLAVLPAESPADLVRRLG